MWAASLRIGLIYAITGVMLLPIVWMVGTSLKPPLEFVASTVDLLPDRPTLDHYRALIADDILGKVLNSLTVAIGATVLALAAGFPAAYALARMSMPRGLDSLFLLFVLVVKLSPPLVLAIPLYQVLRTIGLLDTLPGLILVYQVYCLPFAIWMLLGFVRDVPITYEDAAKIEGAGLARRLATIVLPLMTPGLMATTVFLMILCWNEFAYALLFIQTPSKFTLPTYIATLITEDETFWGQLTAIGFLASLPILALVCIVQRGLTRGFAGGLK
jgi:multiple sugar transport system permease protein